ncbi:cell division protein FtsQ/DivIB [Liquorilactobacillus capillatus]|uniref:Cell division protein DivIB n=1 Tax=Liquorilactobacillus capillatus DSM 19910 TaxID=1423731 RepID=A0A0R1M1A7_9LACO|nr:cell division protein FtsQ/DivIB [Liquorilactobacillus capillatus]KRL01417.1 cell division protein [Liquorilactobacillus capillatus DSM 19910]
MSKLKKNKFKSQVKSPLTPWEQAQQERKQKLQRKKHNFFKRERIGNKLPDLVRQRRKILYRHLTFNLVLFLVLGLIALYLILPISKVQKLMVSGTDQLTQKAIIKAGGVRTDNLIIKVLLNEEKIKTSVKEKVTEIKDVKLVIKGTTVNYKVKEFPIVGYVAEKGKYYRLNSRGEVSKVRRDEAQGNYPLYYDFRNQRRLAALAKQIAGLPSNLRSAISEIHYTPSDVNSEKIKIYMNDGNEVIASISTLAQKMVYYPSIKAKASNKILVDFEVGAYSYPLK